MFIRSQKESSAHRQLTGVLAAVLLLCQTLWCTLPVQANPSAPSAPQTPLHNSGGSAGSAPLALDLSSTSHSLTAGVLSNFHPVNIVTGNTTLNVGAATPLTPAEFSQVQQVLSGNAQTLVISTLGNAVAGSVNVGNSLLSGLVIPQGVTALDSLNSTKSSLVVSGLLQNSGLLSFFNNGTATSAFTGTVIANTINNLAGGVIQSTGHLNLYATQSITNAGLINASGNLSLTTPLINNTGLISSNTGNVIVTSPTGSLTVNSTGGTIQALNGNIQVSTDASTLASGINLNGGNYLSQQLNIDAAKGSLGAMLDNVTGIVNINAGSSEFGAATPDLRFGNVCVQGDPIFFNTQGSLFLSNITPTQSGGDLVFVASGDIIITGGTLTTSDSTAAGNIWLLAGAGLLASNPELPGQETQSPPGGDTNSVVLVSQTINQFGGSTTGGAILLQGVSAVNAGGTRGSLSANGGNVNMVAYSGTGAGNGLVPGSINLGGATINTSASGAGTNGNVRIIAGATSGAGVSGISAITSGNTANSSLTNQLGDGGSVRIETFEPDLSIGLQFQSGGQGGGPFSSLGPVLPTSVTVGSISTSNGSMAQTGKLITPSTVNSATAIAGANGGKITIQAGSTLVTGNLTTSGQIAPTNLGGDAGSGGNAGNISLTSGGGMYVQSITANGGNGGTTIFASGAGGNGGNGATSIALTSNTGSISMGYGPSGQQSIQAGGGGGGAGAAAVGSTAAGSSGSGGDGAANVSISAGAGNIALVAIDVSGGGGAGGDSSGTNPGMNGGNGGNAGNVSINTTLGSVYVGSYIGAAGGGGGGGGGPLGGSAGGGGASTLFAGSGGNSSSSNGGGGGGAGGQFPATGGASVSSGGSPNAITLTGGAGGNGNGPATGGAGGTFATGGSPGIGAAGGGGTGGGLGQSGSTPGFSAGAGGNAGNGGTINISGRFIQIAGTMQSLPVFAGLSNSTPHIHNSLIAVGANGATGSITVNSTGAVAITSALYSADGNLATGSATLPAPTFNVSGGPFYLGYAGTGNGSVGSFEAVRVTINGTATSGSVTPTPTAFNNTQSLTLNENGTLVSFKNGGGINPTPAELMALVMLSVTGQQGLELTNGEATGGTFTINSYNLPAISPGVLGLASLVIPAGVTGTVNLPLLTVAPATVGTPIPAGDNTGNINIAGTLNFPATVGPAYVNANTIEGYNDGSGLQTGTIQAMAGTLTLTAIGPAGTGNIGTPALNGALNTTANTLTLTATGSAVVINTVLQSSTTGLLTLNASSAGNNSLFSVTNYGASLTTTGNLSAGSVTLISKGSGPIGVTTGLTINGNITASQASGGIDLEADSSGGITQALGTLSTPGSLTLLLNTSGVTGTISLGQGTTVLSASGLQINSDSNAVITDIVPVTIGTSTLSAGSGSKSASLTLTDLAGITISSGSVVSVDPGCGCTYGSIALTTPSITNLGTLSAAGNIVISSPPGQGLTLLSAPTGGTYTAGGIIQLNSPNNFVDINSNNSFNGPLVINAPNGAALISSGFQTISGTNTLTVQAGAMINFNNSTLSLAPAFIVQTSGSLGTIVNTNGSVVLMPGMFVNSNGKSVAILSSADVVSQGLSVIDLSSPTGQAGSLTIIAGEKFNDVNGNPISVGTGPSGSPPNQAIIDISNTNYVAAGPSITGGSISLAGVTILTNSSGSAANGGNAGNVVMVANQGNASAGVVISGPIYASSTFGHGGTVTLVGPGGVIVNGPIMTSGPQGGGNVSIYGATPDNTNAVVGNGYLAPNARFLSPGSFTTITAGVGSAVTVNGPILANSTTGAAGAVDVRAETGITVAGDINTSGLTAGGAVNISALSSDLTVGGSVLIEGNIITNGLLINNTASTANGADGGSAMVEGADSISVLGGIYTYGGTTYGTGNGGTGGLVCLCLTPLDNSNNLTVGNILIGGSILTAGGNANMLPTGGTGGLGGAVETTSGTLQIYGVSTYNGVVSSINANGGLQYGGAGLPPTSATGGSVLITTTTTQSIPSNFNLFTAVRSEYVLPGGLFNVGNPTVNGTAGNIVSDADVASPANAANLLVNPSNPVVFPTSGISNINIAIEGNASQDITETDSSGNPHTVTFQPVVSGSTRMLATPAEALALYQTATQGNTQALQLLYVAPVTGQSNQSGVLVQGPNPNNVTINQWDLPAAFSTFVLQAANPNGQGVYQGSGLNLSVAGRTPVINLSQAALQNINATLSFSNGPGYFGLINSGAAPLVINEFGSISSGGGVFLYTYGGVYNFGSISAQQVVAEAPYGNFVITNNGGVLQASDAFVLPANSLPQYFAVSNINGGFVTNGLLGGNIQYALRSAGLPVVYGQQLAMFSTAGTVPVQTAELVFFNGYNSRAHANVVNLSGNLGQVPTTFGSTATLAVYTAGEAGATAPDLHISAAGINVTNQLVFGIGGSMTVLNSNLTSQGIVSIEANASPTLGTGQGGFDMINGTLSGLYGVSIYLPTGVISSATQNVTISAPNGTVSITALGTGNSSQVGTPILLGQGNTLTGAAVEIQTPNGMLQVGTSGASSSGNINATSGEAVLLAGTGISLIDTNVNGAGGIYIQSTLGSISITSPDVQAANLISDNSGITILARNGNVSYNNFSGYFFSGPTMRFAQQATIIGLSVDLSDGIDDSLSINQSIGAGSVGDLVIDATRGDINIATNSDPSFSLGAIISSGNFIATAAGSFNTALIALSASKSVSVRTYTGDINVPSTGVNIYAQNGITLQADQGNVSIFGASTTTGNITLLAGKTVNLGNGLFQAGTQPTILPSNQVVNVTQPGNVVIFSGFFGTNNGGLTIAHGGSIQATGNIDATIFGGNIQLDGTSGAGSNNSFTAYGGNIIMLASGTITNSNAGSGTQFTALGNAQTGAGGAIELGSGVTSSQLGFAFAQAPGTVPTASIGATINNAISGPPANGAVVVLGNVAAVNLNNAGGGGSQSTLNLGNASAATPRFGGAIQFDTIGAGSSVSMDGATFTVTGFVPIAYTYAVTPMTEFVLGNDQDQHGVAGGVYQLAHIFVPGRTGAQVLTARKKSNESTNSPANTAQATSGSTITMTRGEMFVNPLTNSSIRSAYGEVHARKGSLVSVVLDRSGMRVTACSGPGDVTVIAGGKTITALPGEEIVISDHRLDRDEQLKADGVGRRIARTFALSDGLFACVSDVSLISMMSNIEHLSVLVRPTTAVEQQIANRMLKQAAVLQTVTNGRGAFQARSALRTSELRSPYTPVSHVE